MPILISVLFSVLVLLSVILLTPYTRYFQMKPFVCLSAGGLLSVTFLDFLPHSFSHQHSEWTGWLILSGLLIQGIFDFYGVRLLKFLDRLLMDTSQNLHYHSHHHSHILSPSGVCSIVGCLSICSFFDGIRFFFQSCFRGSGRAGNRHQPVFSSRLRSLYGNLIGSECRH